MLDRNYYATHSALSNPGKYAQYFDHLPNNIAELCCIVRNLFLHMDDEKLYGFAIAPERYCELDARSIEKKLEIILSFDDRLLSEKRKVAHRVIGVCRDMSFMLCAILRHKNIPARLISGFSNYYIPGLYLDSTCVKYWDEKTNQWHIVDVRTSEDQINYYQLTISFNLHQLTENQFMPAETAWALCRNGMVRANHFGSKKIRGLWYVRNRMIHELAFRNKQEMLIWDLWGYMLSDHNNKPYLPESQMSLLDEISQILLNNNISIESLQQFYLSNPEIKLSYPLGVFNPMLAKRMEYV